MAQHLAQRDLRNDNARVIDRVEAGTTFVVTRNGRPVAELRPIAGHRRRFVPREEIVASASGAGHIDAAAFRRDLDDAIDQRL